MTEGKQNLLLSTGLGKPLKWKDGTANLGSLRGGSRAFGIGRSSGNQIRGRICPAEMRPVHGLTPSPLRERTLLSWCSLTKAENQGPPSQTEPEFGSLFS